MDGAYNRAGDAP